MKRSRFTWSETGGGLVLAGFGLAVICIASVYNFGTPRRMGPGFMPIVVGAFIVMLGIAIAFSPKQSEPPEKLRPKEKRITAPILVFAAIGAWAILLEPFGLIIATAVLVLISAFAHPKPNPVRIGASLILLPALAVTVFVWGLHLPVSALPEGW